MEQDNKIVKVNAGEILNETAALQANAGLRFTLLGKKYLAVFEKGANDNISFVIIPDPEQQEEECSLTELCIQLNGVVKNVSGTQDDVFNAETMGKEINQYTNTSVSNKGAADIQVKVSQLFLYIHKKGSEPLDVQYAISLSLNLSEFGLNLGDAVSLDSVWVSLWNTELENILNKMEIEDIEKLIGQQ